MTPVLQTYRKNVVDIADRFKEFGSTKSVLYMSHYKINLFLEKCDLVRNEKRVDIADQGDVDDVDDIRKEKCERVVANLNVTIVELYNELNALANEILVDIKVEEFPPELATFITNARKKA